MVKNILNHPEIPMQFSFPHLILKSQDNQATIICMDPARKYSSKVYSIPHFSVHDVELQPYTFDKLNVDETQVIPDHIYSLPIEDTAWEKITGKIGEIIETVPWIHTGFTVALDIINSKNPLNPNALLSTIIFEDIKALKDTADFHFSPTVQYEAYLNAQNQIAIVIHQTQMPTGVVIARVKDNETKIGIPNAKLTLSKDSPSILDPASKSIHNGMSRFDGIQPGTYTLTASHENYEAGHAKVIVEAGRTTGIIELNLSRQATIEYVRTDPENVYTDQIVTVNIKITDLQGLGDGWSIPSFRYYGGYVLEDSFKTYTGGSVYTNEGVKFPDTAPIYISFRWQTPSEPGEYEFHDLVVETKNGLRYDIPIITIAVDAASKPIAVMDATPQSGDAPLRVSFSSNGSRNPDGGRLRYNWFFGDGDSSAETNPVHTYFSSGDYEAKLIVYNENDIFDIELVVSQ